MDFKAKILKNLDLLQKYILYLLYAQGKEPVKGKLWLHKELFLVSKNDPDLDYEADFSAHLMGPYSEDLDEALSQLESIKVIDFLGKDSGPIRLSPLGVEIAKEVAKNIPEKIKVIIDEMKSFVNDMTERELLAYIYFSFPDMTRESVKLEEIAKDRLDLAIKLYSKEKVSLEKASNIAGLPVKDFINELKKKGIKDIYR
jgi:predicted HTH domain antitoxin